jgi:hypothetical protein
MRSGPGEARTILLLHIISVRPSKHPLMVLTFLKVYMELGSYFLFLQEQIKDIIIISPQKTPHLSYSDITPRATCAWMASCSIRHHVRLGSQGRNRVLHCGQWDARRWQLVNTVCSCTSYMHIHIRLHHPWGRHLIRQLHLLTGDDPFLHSLHSQG